MPCFCYALFRTATRKGQVINNRGEALRGKEKLRSIHLSSSITAGNIVSSLPCPAPVCEPSRDFAVVCDLVFSPQKRDKK